MPFKGVPDNLTKKMDSCISQVMAKEPGTTKSSAIAICKARIMPKPEPEPEPERSAVDKYSRPVQSPIRSMGNGRYECYAVRFNGPEDKDLFDTYFDQNTRYYLDYYKSRPWLYEHGLHPSVGRSKVGDWDEAGIDDDGVFVRGELDEHHKYNARIEALIAAGVLYPSSGAVSRTVRVSDDGHVEDWAIDEISSTVRPADWRKLGTVSSAARSAMDAMLDEYITEVNEMGLKKNLLEFLGGSSDSDRSDDVDMADEVDEVVDVVAADVDAAADTDDDGDTPDEEFARSLVEAVGKELTAIRTAIIGMDAAIKEQSESVASHTKLLAGLSAQEIDRTQRSIQDGSWLQDLYTASRSDEAPVATEGEDESARQTPVPSDATMWERVSGQVQ